MPVVFDKQTEKNEIGKERRKELKKGGIIDVKLSDCFVSQIQCECECVSSGFVICVYFSRN